MASKRQRGESSGASSKYDGKRFVSHQASERYHKWLVGKTLIPERGLLIEDGQDGELAHMISRRNWMQFTAQPGPAAVRIVKEFYANAIEAKDREVIVRGHAVKFSRKAINAYYGTAKIKPSGYRKYLHQDLDYDEIINALCVPGTEWKLTDQHEAVHFPSSALGRYGKAWHAFICARLMPCRHMSDVTNQRAVLLFCIAQGKTVDIGHVIYKSIADWVKGGTLGGIPHPSLITELCRQAGVRWDAEETLQPPLAPIDHSVISRYKIWSGGVSHPRGLGFIIAPPEPQPTEHPPAAEPNIQPPTISDDLRRDLQHHTRRLDLVATQIQAGFERMDRHQACLAQRQAELYAYNINSNSALAEMFSRLNPAAGPFQFPPPPPPLSVFPPPAVSAADDEDDDDDDGDDMA